MRHIYEVTGVPMRINSATKGKKKPDADKSKTTKKKSPKKKESEKEN